MSIRWGVIGAGKIAERRTIPEGIIPSEDGELVAVMRLDEEKARALGEKFQCAAYTREEELLDRQDIDAVYIATPTHLHYRQTLAALEAGKHVLCEKPVAMTVQEAEDMVRKAEDLELTLALGFMMRFHAHHQKIKEFLNHGECGQIVAARAQFSCWYPDMPGAWRQVKDLGGGGVVMDMAVHAIDLLEMLVGKILKVNALSATLTHGYEVEDSTSVSLQFENGALGSVNSHFNLPGGVAVSALEVYGTQGSVEARGTLGQTSDGKVVARVADAPGSDQVVEREITADPVNMYQAQIEDVNAAIREKRQPVNSAENGLRSQRIMLAIYQSVREGRTIAV